MLLSTVFLPTVTNFRYDKIFDIHCVKRRSLYLNIALRSNIMGIGWFGKVEKQSTARPRHNRHIIVTSCCCFSVLSWILPRLIAPCACCPLPSHRPVKSHTRPLFQSNPSSTHQSKNVSFIILNLLLTQQRFKVAKWCNLCGNLFIHNF